MDTSFQLCWSGSLLIHHINTHTQQSECLFNIIKVKIVVRTICFTCIQFFSYFLIRVSPYCKKSDALKLSLSFQLMKFILLEINIFVRLNVVNNSITNLNFVSEHYAGLIFENSQSLTWRPHVLEVNMSKFLNQWMTSLPTYWQSLKAARMEILQKITTKSSFMTNWAAIIPLWENLRISFLGKYFFRRCLLICLLTQFGVRGDLLKSVYFPQMAFNLFGAISIWINFKKWNVSGKWKGHQTHVEGNSNTSNVVYW